MKRERADAISLPRLKLVDYDLIVRSGFFVSFPDPTAALLTFWALLMH